MSRLKRRKRLIIISFISILLSICAILYFFIIKDFLSQDPSRDDLIKEIGEHIILPKKEIPEILEISSQEVIDNQSFFQGATVGDIVLVYMNPGKAILYSRKQKKIINTGPIYLDWKKTDLSNI